MGEYGYVRVSSRDQNEARQMIALREAGVPDGNIYLDKQSGKDFDRPAWKRLKRKLKKGDVVFIKSLDRMGRDYKDVQEQWRALNKVKGVDIVILDMPLLDTRADKNLVGTLISDIVLQLLAFVAQTERENIRQRQREGIDAAMARGVKFGRPLKGVTEGFEEAYQAWISGQATCSAASQMCGMPRGTFYNYAMRRKPDDVPRPPCIQTASRRLEPPKPADPPPHFDAVYQSWLSGGVSMKDAALLLGISTNQFKGFAAERKEGAAHG